MSAPFPILRLRREQDETIYAHMCLTCGGASKVYHTQQVCYCGAMSLPHAMKAYVEGPWRPVRWDGRQHNGTLTIHAFRRTLCNSGHSRGWYVLRDGADRRGWRVYPTKREAVRAAKRRCARVRGKVRLVVGDKEMSLS